MYDTNLEKKDIDDKRNYALDIINKSNKDYYKAFRNIAHHFTVEEMMQIFDYKTIKNIFSGANSSHEYKLFVILMEKDANATINYALHNDKIFDELFKSSDKFYSMFSNLDYNLLRDVILKMNENVVNYPCNFISVIDKKKQKSLLYENISDEALTHILKYFSNDVISYFFEKDPRALYLFENFDIKTLINRGVRFNDEIIKKKEFFDILKGQSIVELRHIINEAEKNNNALYLEKRMHEYHDEIINSYDSDNGVFKDYLDVINDPNYKLYYNKSFIIDDKILYNIGKYRIHNYRKGETIIKKEELTEYLKDMTSKKLSEVIIDALFEDNIYNVWLNIKEMLRYNEKLKDNEKVIDSDKKEFYKTILNIDNISCEEKIDLFKKLKNKKISFMYYYDLRKLKDLSYDLIKRDLFDVSNIKNKDNLSIELTKKYGVSIYDMRDEEYTMLIRCQGKYRDSDIFRRNCYSIIGNENTSSYGNGGSGFINYGYNSFENDRVMHVLEQDSFSTDTTDGQSSDFVNRIMTSDEIVRASNWYSEIDLVNIKNKNGMYDAKKPDYLVYYENSNNIEEYVEEAKRLNIPIVIIKDTELSIDREIDIDFDMNTDHYINYEDRDLREERFGGFGRK
ncbi:MAG: hypothetical protein IKE90_04045 [Bacilli bacterium]|nr:hypothetical protein [Bacilli bacterium]